MAFFGVVTGVSMTKVLKGIITLFLIFMYLVDLKSHGVEARKMVEQIEDDLELERQLKILNVPSLKTIRTKEGDIFDCIDFYKQPALANPLLKDHKIQMKPSFIPKGKTNKTSSATKPFQIIFKHEEECPQGTVPIRRTSKEDLLRARALSREFTTNISQSKRHFTGQYVSNPQLMIWIIHIVDVNDEERRGIVHGASAKINVYNPTVEPSQFTNAQIWINGGPNENPNYIMAGWTVNPGLYGDHRTRLFTFWTGDNYQNGCYNTLCTGFVQVDRSITPSMILDKISTVGGHQIVVKVFVHQDRETGNWWLLAFEDDINIGYWPKSLFTYLADGAKSVSWGGLAKAGSNGVSPPMGSGYFPNNPNASFFQHLELVNVDYQIDHPHVLESKISTRVDAKNCYGIRYDLFKPETGATLVFGGPGGSKCG
ncbi:uncharacterized protein LOC122642385 [Telopea speciosissima]|uniref:uncharacterized protein LOC122642385 n=1 Tax=Telopea speciosissima TaxID=54955 RepID=UPI001CC3538B|nr:uncharacterized protein LOC122642385 [Telopea speciosissima]